MLTRRVLWAISLATVVAGVACSEDDPPPATASCPKGNPECRELATEESGKEAVRKRKCIDCHGEDMAGRTTPLPGFAKTPQGEDVELYPPNLTSDDTGVGDWTDDDLALAIRTGVDDNAEHLCPQMVHFSDMSDFEVYSIIKYLRAIPKVKQQVPRSICPPQKTKAQQNEPR